jgi:hypothetical protein
MRSRRLGALLAVVLMAAAFAPPAGAHASPLPGAPACPLFPSNSYWHADVSRLPVDPKSSSYVASAGATASMHADFGAGLYAGGPIGIPYTTVPGNQPRVPIGFDYADESDPGPYPIPTNPPIEGGAQSTGDRHVLVVDRDGCMLYETFSTYPNGDGTWHAGSGARFDLTSNAFRPDTFTSADAAGLPILPGLVRYDEVASGEVDHAIRVTLNATDRRYVWPARHQAGSANPNLAPMGERFRLRADYDVSRFPVADQVILRALKRYGMIVADNGSSWFISGVPDDRWDNDVLHQLGGVKGSDFEAVDESSLVGDPSSGAVSGAPPPVTIPGGYVLDGFGGLHGFAIGAGPLPPATAGGGYWPGWDIAAGVALRDDRTGGYVLDGWGGLHPFAPAGDAGPALPLNGPYWRGWSIARGVALMPDGKAGYVLDGWGGLHGFALPGSPLPPAAHGNAYWPGWDIARGVTILPDGSGGYVLDGWGGLHAFALGSGATPPAALGPYWRGWSIARGVTILPDGSGGYVLDGWGGLHPFAVGPTSPAAPATRNAPSWPGWDISRGVAL